MIDYDGFLSRAAKSMKASAIRSMGALGAAVPDLISFAPGYPAPHLFAWDEIRDIAKSVLGGSDAAVLQYGPTRGHPPLVDALPAILADRGIRAAREHLIVTTGSQQALDLAARVLIDPGDVVLVELPTYVGAITAFRNAQAALVGVRQEPDGIDLDDLDAVAARQQSAGRRIAFLYLVPNFQNPTGLLIGLDKRRRLLDWAARRQVLIVEDDPYGALYFNDVAQAADTRPIKADDQDGLVVYMSSFSKTVAPGFRVAWIAAPAPIAARMELAKQAADLCSGSLDQQIVYEIWKRGILAARLPVLRDFYRAQRCVIERALARELGDQVSWPPPRGGFFLWAAFRKPIDTETLLQHAIAEKVVYVAGSAFYVDERSTNLARLSFSAASHAQIDEGSRRLAAAVRRITAPEFASAPRGLRAETR